MAILNEIKRMQAEGKTEEEIIGAMKQQGVSPREITEALSQSKIQEAVAGGAPAPSPAPAPGAPPQSRVDTIPMMGEAQMPAQPIQPSQPMPEEYSASPQYPPAQQMQAAQPMQAMPAQAYPEYPQQEYAPAPSISPDTITEISEQVVSEKLSPLRKELEKVIDLKTTLDARTDSLDERLKRIEKIIDRLQLSINQRVGEFLTNVEDIKREITETQKSFKALSPQAPRQLKEEKPRK